jgi:hypothetical protein
MFCVFGTCEEEFGTKSGLFVVADKLDIYYSCNAGNKYEFDVTTYATVNA